MSFKKGEHKKAEANIGDGAWLDLPFEWEVPEDIVHHDPIGRNLGGRKQNGRSAIETLTDKFRGCMHARGRKDEQTEEEEMDSSKTWPKNNLPSIREEDGKVVPLYSQGYSIKSVVHDHHVLQLPL